MNDTDIEYPPKHCDFCSRTYREGEHDPCLENLPGVAFACCGHGKNMGYISFTNGLYVQIETHKIGRMVSVPDVYVPGRGLAVTPKAPNTNEFWNTDFVIGRS